MKSREHLRRGASLATALLLFLQCALASWCMIGAASASARRAAAVRAYEQQYASASSAARLIRDSMCDPEKINVLTMVCLQAANGQNEVLTITMRANRLPPAVCRVRFDSALNLRATIETRSLTLRLIIPATTSGVIGWSEENARIECLERRATGDGS